MFEQVPYLLPKQSAELKIVDLISAGAKLGFFESIKATTAETCGVAIEVPSKYA
jgi:hypothetical protein